MNQKILHLAIDVLHVTALEMSQYREFLLEQAKVLNIGNVEYTWVWMYINLNKSKLRNKSIPDWYLSSSSIPSKTIKFNTSWEDFDFIVSCHDGYVNLIEIVSWSIQDAWNGKFDTYEFIDN